MIQGAGDATLHPLVQGSGSHPPLLTIGIPCLLLIIEGRKLNQPQKTNLFVFPKLPMSLNPFCSDVGPGCGLSGGLLLVNDGIGDFL